MKPCRSIVLAGLLVLGACSTGGVDRGLFARTQDETYQRVRAAVPVGTTVEGAGATMKRVGWSCYRAPPHTGVTPNDTGIRVYGPAVSCEAHPGLGGYPFAKEYDADFLIQGDLVGALQVTISAPGV